MTKENTQQLPEEKPSIQGLSQAKKEFINIEPLKQNLNFKIILPVLAVVLVIFVAGFYFLSSPNGKLISPFPSATDSDDNNANQASNSSSTEFEE